MTERINSYVIKKRCQYHFGSLQCIRIKGHKGEHHFQYIVKHKYIGTHQLTKQEMDVLRRILK